MDGNEALRLSIRHCIKMIISDLEELQEKKDDYSLGERSGMVNALKTMQLALGHDWEDDDHLRDYGLDIDPEKYL